MELTVLGSSGAWPGPGRAATGYLLRHDGFSVWLDAGPGTLSNLQLHVPYHGIDAVVVSHEHPDHCLDLFSMYTARRFHPEPLAPLPLFAAPGVFDRVATLDYSDIPSGMAKCFDVRTVEPGTSFEVGPFRVDTRLLPHWVPNAGTRFEADGRVFAFTGDTGPSDDIEWLGRDADLLVTEASWQDVDADRPPYHLTARQAAVHAERGGARALMLSHFWPTYDREVSRQEAAEGYHGDLLLADEQMRVEVGG